MSTISATPRHDVIPGYAIPVATFKDFWMVEEELERRHMAAAGASAVNLPDAVASKIIDAATNNAAAGRFRYNTYEFRANVFSTGMTEFLLFVLLRNTSKEMTQDKAAALVTDENRNAINRCVLEQFRYGYLFKPDKSEPVVTSGNAEATVDSTGTPSPNA